MAATEGSPTSTIVSRDELLGPLRQLVASATAEPVAWRLEQLSGGFGNPVSLGLYRVSGEGQDGGRAFTWSLVLKMAQSPANVGMPDLGGGDDVTHWNYWRREALLYQSDLLARLPSGLAAPRCYGVAEQPGNVTWLWLETIVDGYDGRWPVARYELAARHLGRMGGAFADGWRPEAYPWLSRSQLRQFTGEATKFAPWSLDAEGLAAAMKHPIFDRLFTPSGRDAFRTCVLEQGRLLDTLDQLPRTFGHQDAYPTNLMSRRDANGQEITVALDWALAGLAPLGSDLAQLFIGLCLNVGELDPAEAERLLMSAYRHGLRDSGWAGDEDTAVRGFLAATVVRLTFLLRFFLGPLLIGKSGSGAEATLDTLAEQIGPQARLLESLAGRT